MKHEKLIKKFNSLFSEAKKESYNFAERLKRLESEQIFYNNDILTLGEDINYVAACIIKERLNDKKIKAKDRLDDGSTYRVDQEDGKIALMKRNYHRRDFEYVEFIGEFSKYLVPSDFNDRSFYFLPEEFYSAVTKINELVTHAKRSLEQKYWTRGGHSKEIVRRLVYNKKCNTKAWALGDSGYKLISVNKIFVTYGPSRNYASAKYDYEVKVSSNNGRDYNVNKVYFFEENVHLITSGIKKIVLRAVEVAEKDYKIQRENEKNQVLKYYDLLKKAGLEKYVMLKRI